MAEPTVPRPAVQNWSLTEFRTLCETRDARAYNTVGGAQTALAYLNMGEVEMARTALLNTLGRYQEADDAINSFRKEHSYGHAA